MHKRPDNLSLMSDVRKRKQWKRHAQRISNAHRYVSSDEHWTYMDLWIPRNQIENPTFNSRRPTIWEISKKLFVIFGFLPSAPLLLIQRTANPFRPPPVVICSLFMLSIIITSIHQTSRHTTEPYIHFDGFKNDHFNWIKRDFSQSWHERLEKNEPATWSIQVNLLG